MPSSLDAHMNKPSQLAVAVVACALLYALYEAATKGISPELLAVYGFPYGVTAHNVFGLNDTRSQMLYDSSGIVFRRWADFACFISARPLLYCGLALLMRAANWIALFGIAKVATRDWWRAFICTLLITMAGTYVPGWVLNDPWGPLAFSNTQIATALFLFGYLLLLRENILLGALSLAASFHFHALFAISGYAFLIFPTAVHMALRKEYKRALTVLLPIGASCALFLATTTLPTASSHAAVAVSDWVRFIMLRDFGPVDVSIIFSIANYGLTMCSLCVAYVYTARRDKTLTLIDLILINGLLLCIACVAMELLHASGVSFGPISALFAAIQLRRGLWVIFACAVLGLSSADGANGSARYLAVLTLAAIAVICNNFMSAILLMGYAAYVAPQPSGITRHCVAALALGLVALTCLLAQAGHFTNFPYHLSYTGVRASMVLAAISLYVIHCTAAQPTRAFTLLLVFCSIALAASPQTVSSAISQTKSVARLGNPSYLDVLKLAKPTRTAQIDAFADALLQARSLRREGLLLIPKDAMGLYNICAFYGVPVYMDIVSDTELSQFSLGYADNFNARLVKFLGISLKEILDKKLSVLEIYDATVRTMDAQTLRKVGVTVVITTERLERLKLAYTNGTFNIYVSPTE